jgi:cyclopropane fatty-acyl-phospholipid synthase-like methyltransferase
VVRVLGDSHGNHALLDELFLLPENVFDAVISWGMMFHLTRGDQATAFASASQLLKPGGSGGFLASAVHG